MSTCICCEALRIWHVLNVPAPRYIIRLGQFLARHIFGTLGVSILTHRDAHASGYEATLLLSSFAKSVPSHNYCVIDPCLSHCMELVFFVLMYTQNANYVIMCPARVRFGYAGFWRDAFGTLVSQYSAKAARQSKTIYTAMYPALRHGFAVSMPNRFCNAASVSKTGQ